VVAILMLWVFPWSAAADSPFAEGGADHVTAPDGAGRALRSGTEPPGAAATRSTITVPLWNSGFQYNGQPFGSTMVGTDPNAGSATTTVPVVIVPLRIVFPSEGAVLDYPGMAQELVGSPLFTPAPFITGTTQYVDAYRRGDFWNAVTSTSPGYHILLGSPYVADPQTVTVPAGKGHSLFDPNADRRFGWVDGTWFSARVKEMIRSLHIDPRALAVLLAPNLETILPGSGPCPGPSCESFGGYHGSMVQGNPIAGSQPAHALNTYAYAEFLDLGDLVPPVLNFHLAPISHELLEWADDPLALPADPNQNAFGPTTFGSFVPAWTSPYFPGGCSSLYEVADPLETGGPLVGVPDSGHLDLFADAVFQSWFARASPSSAIGGRYDIAGALNSHSSGC
jgi:hypothetical protein